MHLYKIQQKKILEIMEESIRNKEKHIVINFKFRKDLFNQWLRHCSLSAPITLCLLNLISCVKFIKI